MSKILVGAGAKNAFKAGKERHRSQALLFLN
jgi:hypothetical protein